MLKRSCPFFIFLFISTFGLTQKGSFSFGLRSGVSISQIEGDNLRGFKKTNLELGLLGGFRFSDADEFQLAFSFENTGSNRRGEALPRITGNYLTEVRLDQVSLLFAYARSFAVDWDGSFRYRAYTGLKMNRIMESYTNISGASINDVYSLSEDDFRNTYLSIRTGVAYRAGRQFLLGIFYEHSLQSILKDSEEIRINKLVPFSLGLSFSYFIN